MLPCSLYFLFFLDKKRNKKNQGRKPARIVNAEFTVVQKPNQGTNRKKGCNLFPGSFFVSFLDKQKRKANLMPFERYKMSRQLLRKVSSRFEIKGYATRKIKARKKDLFFGLKLVA
jgi:hypothetical protein